MQTHLVHAVSTRDARAALASVTGMESNQHSVGDLELTDAQQRYVADLRSRIRTGRVAALLRTGGLQVLWIIVIVAGAGVSLSDAVTAPSWVAPTLGFVVVVAAGVERIFSRATPAAAAQDRLRRGLAREQRLFAARAEPYTDDEAFALYSSRSEALLAEYDRVMLDYSSSLARRIQ